MRYLFLPLALAATLAGCTAASGAPMYGPSPDTGIPAPHARIVPSGAYGVVSFTVDRPAYVALFEMTPGGGMRVMYPYSGANGRFVTAGSYTVHSRAWGGLRYASSAILPYGSPYARDGYAGGFGGASYYYLIASQSPLRVAEYANSPERLRSALGWSTFASFDPYRSMDALADLVLTDATPGTWSSDVYVDWVDATPVSPNDVRLARVYIVQCKDGSRIAVPAWSNVTRCPSDTEPTLPVPPSDSSKVRKPDPRRPEGPREAAATRTRPIGPAVRPETPVQRPQIERPRPERPRPEPTRVAEPPRAPARAEPRARPSTPRPVERPAAERPTPDTR